MVSRPDARSNQFLSSKNPSSSSSSNTFSETQDSKLLRPVAKSMRTVRSKMFQTDRMRSSDGSLAGNSAEIADKQDQFSGIHFSESSEIIETLKSGSLKPDLLDLSQAFSDFSAYSSDISGELQRLAARPGLEEVEEISNGDLEVELGFGFLQRFSSRDLEAELGLGFLVSDDCSTEIFDGLEHRKLELAVKICVKGIGSVAIAVKRCAAGKLRLLAKNRPENRALIGRVGAIPPLVSLLHCHDPSTQENAVTALLNLSLHESNKMEITAAGAIKPLVYVLKTGTAISKQNAACTLMSLSFIEDNKISIGAAGAIPLLVSLLLNGSSRGKKDALTTLYKLSSLRQNKERAIRAGAIKLLIELIADQASGMVDKAVVVLNNLATIAEGKTAIVEEGGIPVLVEVIEEGSMKGREFSIATLLLLCSDSHWNRTLLVREGGIPPLVALSQLGTARAKHKASTLLRYLREPRQGMNLQEEPLDASSSP